MYIYVCIVKCMSLSQFKTRIHDWLMLADKNNFTWLKLYVLTYS